MILDGSEWFPWPILSKMVISIKREILAQLRRIGFHFEPLMLRILPPSTVTELTNEEGIGRTFYIDLPNNADSVFPAAVRINETLLKVSMLKYFRFITKICW